MKYLNFFLSALVASTLVAPAVVAKQIDYIQSALAKTRAEKYSEAIAILKTGEQSYRKRGDNRRAYASKLLALHTQQGIDYRRRQLVGEEQPDNATEGILLGSCLGEDCSHGVEWYAPPQTSRKYGGILVLQKRLRYFKDSRGLQQPIWGNIDVRVMPALSPGEYIQSSCTAKTRKIGAGQIVAIGSAVKRADGSTNEIASVRRAWNVNIRSGRIEDLPAASIVCTVESP